jgi:hypothetical protein
LMGRGGRERPAVGCSRKMVQTLVERMLLAIS